MEVPMNRLALTATMFLLTAQSVLADAIDGDWCSPQGKHLTIRGPEITTPGRVTMQGIYRRHQFSYTAPAGDPDAGVQIYLDLLNEEHMNFYRTDKNGKLAEPDLWKRCEITS
jgi:hypothetical protein